MNENHPETPFNTYCMGTCQPRGWEAAASEVAHG